MIAQLFVFLYAAVDYYIGLSVNFLNHKIDSQKKKYQLNLRNIPTPSLRIVLID